MHSKIYVSKFTKTTYNTERRKYTFNILKVCAYMCPIIIVPFLIFY